jgi:hypothetical protein
VVKFLRLDYSEQYSVERNKVRTAISLLENRGLSYKSGSMFRLIKRCSWISLYSKNLISSRCSLGLSVLICWMILSASGIFIVFELKAPFFCSSSTTSVSSYCSILFAISLKYDSLICCRSSCMVDTFLPSSWHEFTIWVKLASHDRMLPYFFL